jgi:2-amino-4-hydroxy-6-hydroxymethyldihydropteridine diphosphokinase
MFGQKVQGNKSTTGRKRAFVAFGSNLPSDAGAPAESVSAAMDLLEVRAGAGLRRSRLWRTPAFPPGAGPDFVNAAAGLDWAGDAAALLELLHGIEASFGRTRERRWEARLMDLDLLALGDAVLPDAAEQARWAALSPEAAAREAPEALVLPHPRLAERGFVLAPLAEIAPDWRHPVTGRSVAEMLAALPPAALDGVRPIAP